MGDDTTAGDSEAGDEATGDRATGDRATDERRTDDRAAGTDGRGPAGADPGSTAGGRTQQASEVAQNAEVVMDEDTVDRRPGEDAQNEVERLERHTTRTTAPEHPESVRTEAPQDS